MTDPNDYRLTRKDYEDCIATGVATALIATLVFKMIGLIFRGLGLSGTLVLAVAMYFTLKHWDVIRQFLDAHLR